MSKGSCSRRALSLDIYKQPIKLQMPDKKDAYRTIAGTVFSCLTIVLVLTYSGLKLQTLVSLQEFSIQERS